MDEAASLLVETGAAVSDPVVSTASVVDVATRVIDCVSLAVVDARTCVLLDAVDANVVTGSA